MDKTCFLKRWKGQAYRLSSADRPQRITQPVDDHARYLSCLVARRSRTTLCPSARRPRTFRWIFEFRILSFFFKNGAKTSSEESRTIWSCSELVCGLRDLRTRSNVPNHSARARAAETDFGKLQETRDRPRATCHKIPLWILSATETRQRACGEKKRGEQKRNGAVRGS